MLAVSSFRPFADAPESALNVRRAFASWTPVFESVLYFGSPEPSLAGPRVAFQPYEGPPAIRDLMLACALSGTDACLINADIVVSPELPAMWAKARARRKVLLTGWRFEFDPAAPDYTRAARVDNGLDFFVATPGVWRDLWLACPPNFRLGKPVWDSWLYTHCLRYLPGRFVLLRAPKLAFHPRHGDRLPN